MALGLSNLTVSGKAAAGAVVGTLSLLNASGAAMQANFLLDDDCAGFFGVSGSNLVTMNASLPPGNYSVSVSGVGTKTYCAADGNFTITVTPSLSGSEVPVEQGNWARTGSRPRIRATVIRWLRFPDDLAPLKCYR